jgi:hypothetical protein
MGAYAYEDQTGKLPNYHKGVIRATAEKYPMLAMFDSKGVPIKNAIQQWRMDDAPGIVNPETASGKDKDSDTPSSNQGPLAKGTIQICTTDPWKVEDLAEITDQIGMPAGKQADYQQAKNAEQLARSINAVILSDQELQEEVKASGKKWRMRGMYGWLNAALQTTAGYEVDSNYMPAAYGDGGPTYVGTLAAWTEAIFKAQVQRAANTVRQNVSLLGLVGPSLKASASLFNVKTAVTSSTEGAVRSVNNPDLKKYVNKVDFFEVDGGTVQMLIMYDMLVTLSTGVASGKAANSGLFIDTAMWGMAWAKAIEHFPLTNGGGGEKGFHKAICLLKCLNPQGQFCNYSDAA